MILYRLDADYSTLTEQELAELAPQVSLPVERLVPGTVLRGRLSGKMDVPESPGTARFRVALGPPLWGQRHTYKVGDRVIH
ncbi:MAG: hypothetical protein ABFC80_02915, partial [Coriobacteriales bacterium]